MAHSRAYLNAHREVFKYRGPSTLYPCVECSNEAQNWALRWDLMDEDSVIREEGGSPYSLNIFDYFPMCSSCHWKLDQDDLAFLADRSRRSERMKGNKLGVGNQWEEARKLEQAERLRQKNPNDIPGVRETISISQKTNLWACEDCHKDFNPGNLTRHQRSSGHAGKTKVLHG